MEQRVLSINEAFLYRVPPLRSTSGHRAEEWGLGSPSMTARIEMIAVDDVLEIRVFEGETQVAVCPVRCAVGAPPIDSVVDPVVDSSRYFVLRCEENNKHAYVGCGFRERETAYDFKAAIHDFKKSVDRQHKADQTVRERDHDPEPVVDLALKGTIKLQLAGRAPRPRQISSTPLRLPPPPSTPPPSKPADDDDDEEEEAEFGDFETAPS
ncbi:hypothetical protein CTAYLR_005672 [Chrysophaeum taylorii]|uniref:NECAP PHear domain-containing protein n=1 Tax=Chrysophaeum taylorii TaxID=2483200 RepID=A0AAD7UKN5_9STRA|nr:hypothetical protein CTAYLR_005672 [Chrysophaeum taylorii]